MRTGRSVYPLVSGIGLVTVFLICSALLSLHPDINREDVRFMMEHSKRVLSYRITDTRTALFRAAPQDNRLEIISNLDIPLETSASGTASVMGPHDYSLEIRILDSNLDLIRKDVYHESTQVTEWTDSESGIPMKSAYYLEESCLACDSRITSVTLPAGCQKECFIAVRMDTPNQASASVRVYRHMDLTAEKDIKGLRLMPKRFRSKLARHNLFENDLSSIELSHSMTDVLSQIPAETRQGFEYTTRQLFLYEDIAPLTGSNPPSDTTDTSLAQPVFFAVNGPAKLTIRLSSGDPIDTEIRRLDTILSHSVRTPENDQTVGFDFGPGPHILRVMGTTAAQRIAGTALVPADAWLEPDSHDAYPYPINRTAYYRVMPEETGEPVRIELPDPPEGRRQLYRVNCRIPLDRTEWNSENPGDAAGYSLTCRYLDGNGNVLDQSVISGHVIPSRIARYDQIRSESHVPSMPERWYFGPPENTASLEITAGQPVDIAVFSRLDDPGLAEKQQGPAGKTAGSKPDAGYRLDDSGDYYFRPANFAALAESGRKIWITMPAGISEPADSALTAGVSGDGMSCYPSTSAETDYVFEPMSPANTDSASYILLTPGKTETLEVSNSIAYTRPGFHFRLDPVADPFVSVQVNNTEVTRFRPVTFDGYFEVSLPGPGRHTVRILTSGHNDTVFMKCPAHVTCSSERYASRRVFRLEPGNKMTLPLEKESWEPAGLNIMTYRLPERTNPVRLRVSCDIGNDSVVHPVSSLTRPLIRYDGHPGPQPATVLMGSGSKLASPERFFYRINNDQPPDTYSITIESQADEPVYIRFFTVSPDTGSLS